MGFARSLSNYKEFQKEVAKSRGDKVYKEFMAAQTLTQARVILYGRKTKKPTHTGGR
jgi:hypothetical protein